MAKGSLLIYASSSGDQWLLVKGQDGRAFVRRVPNPQSGGESSHVELDEFLRKDRGSPMPRKAFLRLANGEAVAHRFPLDGGHRAGHSRDHRTPGSRVAASAVDRH